MGNPFRHRSDNIRTLSGAELEEVSRLQVPELRDASERVFQQLQVAPLILNPF